MDKNSSILPNEDVKTAISVEEENGETSKDKKAWTPENSHEKCKGIKYREIETLDLPGQEGPVKNTIHATKFGMKLFSEWCAQNNHNIDLENISDDKLNDVLSDFFTNVRTQEGKQYSESSLINFKYSIQRYMSSLPEASRKDLKGPEFYRAKSILMKVIRETRASESGKNVPDKTVMIYLTREDIQKIYECGVFNVDEPNSLLHKVWFEVCLHFCRKNREVQRQMNPDLFEFAEDESGRRYVYYKKLLGYRNTPSNGHIVKDAKDCRMVEVKGHPMCPVRSLEKYLSKIKHLLTKVGCEPCLFYRPRSLWDKRSNDAKWYSTLPVGKNALSCFMASISNKAELSQIYTPIVLKTLPVSKWREIVFESDKHRVPVNSITQDLVSAIKSPNIVPIQPISLTNYLGNIMVSQQQFSVPPPFGLSQQAFIQGAGDATFTAQLSLPTVRSGLPLTISPAPPRSYHTTNGGHTFPKSNDGRQPLYGNVTLVKPKPVYGTTTSALIKPPEITALPERNRIYASSTILANPQCKSENTSSNKALLKNIQPEIVPNQSSLPGRVTKDVKLDKTDQKTSMTYIEAKKGVKDIFDQLDYWALADLVNWMKRVDVLKDTSGKVVCNDPLCKPAVTTKKTSTKLETNEERDEKESGNRGTAAEIPAKVCHENVGQNKDKSALRSGEVKIQSDSYNTVTPENKNKKPKKIKPYQHIPLIQQCSRQPGKSSKAQGRHFPVILNKTSPRGERSLKSKQVQNIPRAEGQNEMKPKTVAIRSPLSLNPHYRHTKQVYPLHIFQNTSSTVLPGGEKTSRSLLRNTKNNKKGSPSVSSHPTCPPVSSIHELAVSPELKRRKLNSEKPRT